VYEEELDLRGSLIGDYPAITVRVTDSGHKDYINLFVANSFSKYPLRIIRLVKDSKPTLGNQLGGLEDFVKNDFRLWVSALPSAACAT